MKVSVIIPAYNEAGYLPETLTHIAAALASMPCSSEVIVVDNDSTDETSQIAESFGARVFTETKHNISRVRNAGVEHATGNVLVFVDADTIVPPTLFQKIADAMQDESCFGGAVSVEYADIQRKWMRLYLLGWKFWGRLFNMKQGAAQFCRSSAFAALQGYDETIFMGEDVQFYWRLARFAKQHLGYLYFVEDLKVTTSARRFNKMSAWKTLVLTHPVFIYLAWRRKSYWKDWYEQAAR